MQERRTIIRSSIAFRFGYCPLVWMFHNKSVNNWINTIHERALRITYDDKTITFQQLLEKGSSVSIHHRNLRQFFQERIVSYNLRSNDSFKSHQVNSVYHGTESLLFLGPKIWEPGLLEIKESKYIK